MTVSPALARIARAACLALEITGPASIEDDSDLARDLKDFFPDARDRCLEAGDWSFASVLKYLPARADLPATTGFDANLPYLYAVPTDACKLLEVGQTGDVWRRDAEGIRSDAPPPLRVRYTATSPAESLWPAEFRTAVSLALAAMLAPRWLTSGSKTERIERRAADAMKQAMRNHAADASQMRYDGLPDQGDWAADARR